MRRTAMVDPRGVRWVIEVPESRRERARGLRGVSSLEGGHGMLLERCRSVHTFGMRFPIDVVLLDRTHRVLHVRRAPPGRVAMGGLRVRHVLECPEGSDLYAGDRLTFDP